MWIEKLVGRRGPGADSYRAALFNAFISSARIFSVDVPSLSRFFLTPFSAPGNSG